MDKRLFPLRKVDSEYSGGKTSRVVIGDLKKRLDSGQESGVGNYSRGEYVNGEEFESPFEEEERVWTLTIHASPNPQDAVV